MKKRIFAETLICLVFLCQLSLSVYSETETHNWDIELYIYDYSIHMGNMDIKADNKLVAGDLSISTKVNNDGESDVNDVTVIAAVYDEDALLVCDIETTNISKKSSVVISDLSLSVPDIDLKNAKLKLFLWQDINAVSPLMNNPIVFPETYSNLTVYPAPDGVETSDKYSVRLSEDNGLTWINSFTYKTECLDKSIDDAYYSDFIGGFTASFTNFEIKDNAPITVEITKLWGDPIKTADVKPHSKNIANVINGNKVVFTITEPALLAVEIDGYPNNGDIDHSICIYANAPMEDVPDKNDPKVKVLSPGEKAPDYTDNTWETLYFMPGYHDIGAGYTAAPGKKYYIPGGAYVKGTFTDLDPIAHDGSTRLKPNGLPGAKVYGYGVISCTGINWLNGETNPKYDVQIRHAIDLYNNKVALEGVTILDTANHAIMMAGWAGIDDSATIKNTKVLNWRKNGDGIHVFCYGIINNCFLRTQDDSIYISSGSQNQNKLEPMVPVPQTISNLVTWNDVNGSAFIFSGNGGNTSLTNCDVLYNRCVFINDTIAQGSGGYVFNLRQQNTNNVTANVDISDIRVEDPFYGKIIRPKGWNKDKQRKGIFFINMQNTNTNNGSVFTNIKFKNITVDAFLTNEDNTSAPVRQNIFNGVSESCKMGSIIFDNLVIGGTKITRDNAENFNFLFINADDVQFN